MRSETEIYELMIGIAQSDERIRAAYINGSRTNKNVPKDIFQDYDIVYVVTETRPFREAKEWIHNFGEIWFMQYPDEFPDSSGEKESFYGWLMQFRDGSRIDLHVESVTYAQMHIGDDKLCRILLDKDNILPVIPEASEEDYYIKRPAKEQFLCTCNEFWWCLNNVAKGLWRQEIPYAQDMMNFHVRKELEKVLSWKIGIATDFSVSVGKSAKYMYKWLSSEEYEMYLAAYARGTASDCWRAVFVMTEIFAATARLLAAEWGYEYNAAEENGCMEFLEHVYNLPADAAEWNS